MNRFLWAVSLVFLTSACGATEKVSRFQGVIRKVTIVKDGKEGPVKGWIYFDDIDVEGIRFDTASIQLTDETKCFLAERQKRKPAATETLKPGMKVEVILVAKVEDIPPRKPPRLVMARAQEILVLEKE